MRPRPPLSNEKRKKRRVSGRKRRLDVGHTMAALQTRSAGKYIDTLRARFFPSGVTHAGYKVPADKDLPSIVINAADKKTVPDPQLLQRCQCLIGSLMFATNARPDIQYTVSQLARCMAWPDANIEAAAERCLIYLIGTRDLGLHYERVADPNLFGCSDANWCTRQSTSGCAFKIGTATVSYFSAVRPCPAMIREKLRLPP